MSTRVTLGLASSTNSLIVLRKMSANIQKVQKALQDLKEKKYRSIRQAALAHDVGKSTIAYRLHGRKSRAQSSSSSRRLTSEQEEVLIKWVEDRQRQILPLNHTTLRELVVQLLQENDDFKPLGKLWTTRFIQRHPPLATGRGRTMDIQRLMALDPNIIKVYFDKVEELRKLHNIEPEDEYNMDEKGFQMGQAGGEAVIVNKSQGPPIIPSTGTSKWVTVIECTSAVGRVLKPMVIHIGKDPKQDWFPPSTTAPDWKFGFSSSGWTNDELALIWLRDVFIPQTARPGKHRLLIMDGHGSHETGKFQYLCMRNNISLVYLPSHASHILQPLDVGPFSPLAHYYKKELHRFTPTGFATVDRATFTQIYQIVRPMAFTSRNIRAGWRRAGLRPYNPDRILQDPQVTNLSRVTPELEVPVHPDDVYSTPKKIIEYRRVLTKIKPKLSPHTRRYLTKLDHGIMETLTANHILQNQVAEDRRVYIDREITRRSKRIEKQEGQRVWNLQQILDARNPEVRRKVRLVRKRKPKRLIVIIPVPINDEEIV
jgi:hypothetical protein